MARILCLDDEVALRSAVERALRHVGHQVVGVGDVPDALRLLEQGGIDVIISDYQLPGIDGLQFLEILAQERDRTPVMMVTGHGSIDHAIAAVRAGAADYLAKPFDLADLIHRVDLLVEKVFLRRELDTLRQEVGEWRDEHRIIGRSPALKRVLDTVTAAAASRVTALIEGESGTGKELIARALHERGDRSDKPFIKLNCGALPEGLVESALFGHEKGAFTGAVKRVEGAFERADGGTLLLDEVSEMRFDLQVKLLRVLQEREFERVGGTTPIKVDVRIVATTNRILADEVAGGRFRQDLFYRLNVIPIAVPPLRERVEDIPLLAYHFASRAATERKPIDSISAEAFDLLQRYPWPGNIRELQHAVERAVILSDGPVLTDRAFDGVRRALIQGDGASLPAVRAAQAAPRVDPDSPGVVLESLNLEAAESCLIAEALRRADNNRTKAAGLLGLGVRTLRKKLNDQPRKRAVEAEE